jgi:hypothetical protein
MWRRVVLVRTNVSEERIAYVISVKGIRTELLVAANVVPSSLILSALVIEVMCSSETSDLTKATRCNIPEVGIIHSHCRENLKSYIVNVWFDFDW